MQTNDNPALLHDRDAGQASVLLLLMLSTFMLGVMTFAVDLTGLWFHRQSAQSAADAACLAGASDMLAKQAGITPPSAFAIGTAGNCASSASAPLCKYAGFNGYTGTGINNTAASNSVSWTFPASVPGATSSAGGFPFLNVIVTENVKTFFTGMLHGSSYQKVMASSTCGIANVKVAPPVAVLNPTKSGAFTYTGGGELDIIGGPSRSLQVNSSSSTGILWNASGIINTSAGGPNQTGSDVADFGGPSTYPTGNPNGFNGGTTGHWSGNNLPLADPFASVAAPSSIKTLTPTNGLTGKWVAYGVDGCPDQRQLTGTKGQSCKEFSPGYYPTGLNVDTAMNNYSTAIFAPGIYYLNGSLSSSGSGTLRMAKPTGYQRTDGVMFYFLSGGLNISGCSGCNYSSAKAGSGIDNVNSTDLTCDGSAPSSALGLASSIYGNVLWGQCANNGTYWDAGYDTSDARGTPGSRGILIFTDHTNTTSPQFTGSGALAFSGTLYLHSNTYATVLSLSGGASSGTYIIGEIVADQISLSGSGKIKLALNPAKTIEVSKVALLQ